MKKIVLSVSLVVVSIIGVPHLAEAVQPSDFNLKEGDVISAEGDPDVYIINDFGYKRLFVNPQIFNLYGHLGWNKIKKVSPATRDAFITSGLFRNCEVAGTTGERVFGLDVVNEDVADLRWVNTTGTQAVADDSSFFQKVFCINTGEAKLYGSGAQYTSVTQIRNYTRVEITINNYYNSPSPTPSVSTTPTPTVAPSSDFCRNIPENQTVLPLGMYRSVDGDCFAQPPSTPTPSQTPASTPTPTPIPRELKNIIKFSDLAVFAFQMPKADATKFEISLQNVNAWNGKVVLNGETVIFTLNSKAPFERMFYNLKPLTTYSYTIELENDTSFATISGTTSPTLRIAECSITGNCVNHYGKELQINSITFLWYMPCVDTPSTGCDKVWNVKTDTGKELLTIDLSKNIVPAGLKMTPKTLPPGFAYSEEKWIGGKLTIPDGLTLSPYATVKLINSISGGGNGFLGIEYTLDGVRQEYIYNQNDIDTYRAQGLMP